MAKDVIRTTWRKRYPWLLVMYILLFGILRGLVQDASFDFAMNLLMWAAFTSYIFLYIFYIFGVKPDELEGKKK